MIIDLTRIRDGTEPARLPDMVEGRTKKASKTWLAERPQAWREASRSWPPVPLRAPSRQGLDQCRRRIQQMLHGDQGRTCDPRYRARRTLRTGTDLLTDKQQTRLDALIADDANAPVEITWNAYQQVIAHRDPGPGRGQEAMRALIDALSHDVTDALPGWPPSDAP